MIEKKKFFKIGAAAVLLLLLVSIVSASNPPPSVSPGVKVVGFKAQPGTVVASSFSSVFVKGFPMEANIEVYFQYGAVNSKFQVYWARRLVTAFTNCLPGLSSCAALSLDPSDSVYVGEWTNWQQVANAGDTFRTVLHNIPTDKVPDAWCGAPIYLYVVHQSQAYTDTFTNFWRTQGAYAAVGSAQTSCPVQTCQSQQVPGAVTYCAPDAKTQLVMWQYSDCSQKPAIWSICQSGQTCKNSASGASCVTTGGGGFTACASNSDCSTSQFCVGVPNGACAPVSCPAGQTAQNHQCACSGVVLNGQCMTSCPSNYVVQSGSCVPCPAGTTAQNNQCVSPTCDAKLIGSPYCKGNAVMQNYQNADCTQVEKEQSPCPNGCQNAQCVTSSCGNGAVDFGESCVTCPADVRCGAGQQCNPKTSQCETVTTPCVGRCTDPNCASDFIACPPPPPVDSDGDGVVDVFDSCPQTPQSFPGNIGVDKNGCSIVQRYGGWQLGLTGTVVIILVGGFWWYLKRRKK